MSVTEVQSFLGGLRLQPAQSQKQDKALDEALESTFPAGDPVAVSRTPSSSGLSRVNWPFRAPVAQKHRHAPLTSTCFKRIDYHPQVLERIHQRMISERLQIAQRFRSEGNGEAARISGQKERFDSLAGGGVVCCNLWNTYKPGRD